MSVPNVLATILLHTPLSRNLRSLSIHIYGIKRLARSHEQSVSLGATKTKIRTRFRQVNLADKRAIWGEYVHAVESFSRPSRRGPYVSIRVATYPIGRAWGHIREQPPILQHYAVHNVINANRMRVARLARHPRIHDVQFLLIGRKANPIRLIHLARNHVCLACLWVQPVNVGGQFESRLMTLVIRHD